jgi:oligopeptide transport system substrate-binding protein
VLTAACGREGAYYGSTTPPTGNVFRFNNGAEPEYLDPGRMAADTDWRIAEAVFEGLTIKDPKTLQPRPGVAESWERSADGLTYTFHLRRGVVWTDGHPVTAHDFVYAWRRVLAPETASQFASQLFVLVNAQEFNKGKIKDPALVGVKALDDYTLEARLHQPIPYFVYLTTTPTLSPVPQWVVEKYGAKWTDPEHIVGNGPFRLVEHRPHDRIVMERNPTYRDAKKVRLDRVVAYAVDDNYTAVNLYKAGDVDWLVSNSVPPDYIPYMKTRYHDFETTPQLASYFYAFNTTRPPLDNPLVRRALALAVDRKAITDELLRGGQIPGAHFVALGLPDYQSPPGPEYNPEEAQRLLAKAGYPNGQGFPQMVISFNTLETHRKIAEAIQQMWEKTLHIHLTLHNEEWASFIKTRRSLQHDIAREGWIADYPDASAFLDLLSATNGNNDTGWKNEEYEALLHQSRGETDPARRRELLYRAEAIVLDQLPVIPIYTYSVNGLLKPYVHGIYPTSLDIHPLNEVCIDHNWSKRGVSEDGVCE